MPEGYVWPSRPTGTLRLWDGSIHYPQRPLIVVEWPVRLPVIEPNVLAELTLPGRFS